jgi:hypothetical protein
VLVKVLQLRIDNLLKFGPLTLSALVLGVTLLVDTNKVLVLVLLLWKHRLRTSNAIKMVVMEVCNMLRALSEINELLGFQVLVQSSAKVEIHLLQCS